MLARVGGTGEAAARGQIPCVQGHAMEREARGRQ